jgi:PKD repeat protein
MINRKTIFTLAVILFTFQIFAFAGDIKHAGKTVINNTSAKITAEPAFGPAPLTVSFDASSFLYHFGEKLSFSWDFNDGGKSEEVSTKHTFNSAGTYTVALKVATPFGEKNSWVVIIVN